MNDEAPEAIVIAVEVDEPLLRERLVELFGAIAGIKLARAGEPAHVALTLPQSSAPGNPEAALTPREREVLELMAEGASNKMIARALGISVHTAKFHVGSVIDKLDATGRTDAVAHAARLGVIRL
jgi:DNA-binding CsgD family transcriptional regulator